MANIGSDFLGSRNINIKAPTTKEMSSSSHDASFFHVQNPLRDFRTWNYRWVIVAHNDTDKASRMMPVPPTDYMIGDTIGDDFQGPSGGIVIVNEFADARITVPFFQTIVSTGAGRRAYSAMTEGSIRLFEPYGVYFLEKIREWSLQLKVEFPTYMIFSAYVYFIGQTSDPSAPPLLSGYEASGRPLVFSFYDFTVDIKPEGVTYEGAITLATNGLDESGDYPTCLSYGGISAGGDDAGSPTNNPSRSVPADGLPDWGEGKPRNAAALINNMKMHLTPSQVHQMYEADTELNFPPGTTAALAAQESSFVAGATGHPVSGTDQGLFQINSTANPGLANSGCGLDPYTFDDALCQYKFLMKQKSAHFGYPANNSSDNLGRVLASYQQSPLSVDSWGTPQERKCTVHRDASGNPIYQPCSQIGREYVSGIIARHNEINDAAAEYASLPDNATAPSDVNSVELGDVKPPTPDQTNMTFMTPATVELPPGPVPTLAQLTDSHRKVEDSQREMEAKKRVMTTLGEALDALATRLNQYGDSTNNDADRSIKAVDAGQTSINRETAKLARKFKYKIVVSEAQAPGFTFNRDLKLDVVQAKRFAQTSSDVTEPGRTHIGLLPGASSVTDAIIETCRQNSQVLEATTAPTDPWQPRVTKVRKVHSDDETAPIELTYYVTFVPQMHNADLSAPPTDSVAEGNLNNVLTFDYLYTNRYTDLIDIQLHLDYAASWAVAGQQLLDPAGANINLGDAKLTPTVIGSTKKLTTSNSTDQPIMAGTKSQTSAWPEATARFFQAIDYVASNQNAAEIVVAINGDPFLFWDMIPTPTEVAEALDGSADTKGHYYVSTYKHTGMPVKLNINYPVYDAEDDGYYVAPFWYRGYYNMQQVVSAFDSGSFRQQLTMYIDTDLVQKAASIRDSSTTASAASSNGGPSLDSIIKAVKPVTFGAPAESLQSVWDAVQKTADGKQAPTSLDQVVSTEMGAPFTFGTLASGTTTTTTEPPWLRDVISIGK